MDDQQLLEKWRKLYDFYFLWYGQCWGLFTQYPVKSITQRPIKRLRRANLFSRLKFSYTSPIESYEFF